MKIRGVMDSHTTNGWATKNRATENGFVQISIWLNVMPFIIDDKRRTDYLEGIRQWDQDRSILTDVVLDCQARFEAQIALQKLREHGVMMEQAIWEAEDDDE